MRNGLEIISLLYGICALTVAAFIIKFAELVSAMVSKRRR